MTIPPEAEEYLDRTTAAAAEAGRAAMTYLLALDDRISWKLNKATIDFRAERQFCSLWPVRSHITFWITKTDDIDDPGERLTGEGRTANLKLKEASDFDDEVRALLAASFRSEGLRPLKR